MTCEFDPLVGKIPREKEMVTHSSILAWGMPWIPGAYSLWGHKERDTTERLGTQHRVGISLVVQWLRLCAFTTAGMGSIPDQGTEMP